MNVSQLNSIKIVFGCNHQLPLLTFCDHKDCNHILQFMTHLNLKNTCVEIEFHLISDSFLNVLNQYLEN